MRSIAFASALEKCRGDAGRCPPSDRIDDAPDLPRHLRSDRSPSSDFPSPSASPSVLFPHLVLGALHFDGISTHQICSPRASDTNPESYQAWPLPPVPPARRGESHRDTALYRSMKTLARCVNRGWPMFLRHAVVPDLFCPSAKYASARFSCTLWSQCEVRSFLITWPFFITNRTRSSSVMSAIGSPLRATRSANFPGSTAPTRSCQPNNSAALVVTARRISSGGIPASCKWGNIVAEAWPRVFPG